MITRLIIFLVINFSSLAISGYFTSSGVPSNWYVNLDKAPWTPPGWIFGFAWSIIMVCFSVYLSILWPRYKKKATLKIWFVTLTIINMSWSPIFFYFNQITAGLIILTTLTILLSIFSFQNIKLLKYNSIYISPYIMWLCLATSLNAYIFIYN